MYYAASIYQMSGFDGKSVQIYTVACSFDLLDYIAQILYLHSVQRKLQSG